MEGSIDGSYLLLTSLKKDLDEEIEWFESNLLLLLDKHIKVLYISLFQKDGEIIKLPWQEKLGLELESLIKEKIDINMSLSKLRIFIIMLSKRLKEFVSRTFCKGKIWLKRPGSQMIKTDIGWLFNRPNFSISK